MSRARATTTALVLFAGLVGCVEGPPAAVQFQPANVDQRAAAPSDSSVAGPSAGSGASGPGSPGAADTQSSTAVSPAGSGTPGPPGAADAQPSAAVSFAVAPPATRTASDPPLTTAPNTEIVVIARVVTRSDWPGCGGNKFEENLKYEVVSVQRGRYPHRYVYATVLCPTPAEPGALFRLYLGTKSPQGDPPMGRDDLGEPGIPRLRAMWTEPLREG